MITPFPVPTHRRFPPIRSAVIRTKEKPSLPVPVNYNQSQQRSTYLHVRAKSQGYKTLPFKMEMYWICWHIEKVQLTLCLYEKWTHSHPASCWRTAQCPHPEDAGVYAHGRDAGSSLDGSTPTHHRRSTLAAALDSPYEGGRRRTSAGKWNASLLLFISPRRVSGNCFHMNKQSWLQDSLRSACSWAGWRGSCSCSRTKPYHEPQPCSGWSDEADPGPSGGNWTNPTGHLLSKSHKYTECEG